MFERLLNLLYPYDSNNGATDDERKAMHLIHRDMRLAKYITIACVMIILISLWGIL